MPKISEKYKTLDDGKADLLGADLVDPSFGGTVTLSGGYTTGSIHYQSRASAIFYESTSNGTNFLALRAPLAVTTSSYFSLPDGHPAASTGYFLTSDTSGNWSWGQVAAGGTAFSAF